MARDLLGRLSAAPGWVVGDRGLASDDLREHIWDLGARPAIPPRRSDAPVACPDWIYNNRHLVENLWARLKEWRALATRYDAPSPPATKRPNDPSSASSASPQHKIGSNH
jgi:transposase